MLIRLEEFTKKQLENPLTKSIKIPVIEKFYTFDNKLIGETVDGIKFIIQDFNLETIKGGDESK
ncbi:hypothetical protein [Fictibacillus sp. JL2B1089]|uniref:hypothetical protein n=1 Tax=Fictibacillus sp. JL2B1089 TaxID=3399565 RepID=UPI003A8776F0